MALVLVAVVRQLFVDDEAGQVGDLGLGGLRVQVHRGEARRRVPAVRGAPVRRCRARSALARTSALLPRYAPRGQRWKASQQKDWHGSGSWRSAQVRRPHGAQLQEAVVAAAVADVVAAAAACIEGDAATAAITWATQSAV